MDLNEEESSITYQAGMSSSDFRTVLQLALEHALQFLDGLKTKSVSPTTSLSDLRRQLTKPLQDNPADAKQVLQELTTSTLGGLMGNAGGRFFGWAIGGRLPASLAADWLTSTWNQNAALFTCSPAAAVVEEICGMWLKDILRLPSTASFALVSGCQMAHVTCLAAARNELLNRYGWNPELGGLWGAPFRIRVLSSAARHGSIDRALRLLGMGSQCIIELPVDGNGRLEVETLQAALAESRGGPMIVVLQAGDLNIGAYDPFSALIPLAHRWGAWVHIDGAFGLWSAASPSHRHLLEGVEQADSWATDGHKWLNVPYDCGYAFVKHPRAHRDAMSYRADYLTHQAHARDQIDWNPEWSRRGRGFGTYAALRQLGRTGIAHLIQRCCQHAQSLVAQIAALPGAELIWKSSVNQGLVRFLDRSTGATLTDHDRWTDTVISAIAETGEAFFSGTTWKGQRCMRISVLNWQTDQADVSRAVAAIERVLEQAQS
jgi:glutamate/tyrosine decarboxylase-like PLP-dependent enzyme